VSVDNSQQQLFKIIRIKYQVLQRLTTAVSSNSRAQHCQQEKHDASFPVRAADVLPGGAADVRSQRHAAEGLQPMGYG
jgi:hypothetical protein